MSGESFFSFQNAHWRACLSGNDEVVDDERQDPKNHDHQDVGDGAGGRVRVARRATSARGGRAGGSGTTTAAAATGGGRRSVSCNSRSRSRLSGLFDLLVSQFRRDCVVGDRGLALESVRGGRKEAAMARGSDDG